MRTPADAFHDEGYLRHNEARLKHLDSLGLLRPGMRVLEVGSGIGDHTAHLLGLGCDVLATDVRKANVEILKKRFPQAAPRILDLDDFPPDEEVFERGFDVVYCYGTLYHLSRPAGAICFMARKGKTLLLETAVSQGGGVGLNLCEEKEDPVHSVRGVGCRPTRDWIWGELEKSFRFVYATVTQPNHGEFPTNWAVDLGPGFHRSVFVASHEEIVGNLALVKFLPQRQDRLS